MRKTYIYISEIDKRLPHVTFTTNFSISFPLIPILNLSFCIHSVVELDRTARNFFVFIFAFKLIVDAAARFASTSGIQQLCHGTRNFKKAKNTKFNWPKTIYSLHAPHRSIPECNDSLIFDSQAISSSCILNLRFFFSSFVSFDFHEA